MSDTSLVFYLLAKDGVSSILSGLDSNFKKVMLGIGVGAVGAAAKLVTMAGDFESSTNRLVTSAGETHAGLDVVRKGMLTMAGQVGDSAMSLSQAMYIIESGGQHAAAGLTVLRAAAEGAKAEGADLTTVADALTSVLQDYHLKASDSALVTSKMVAAVGAGKTTFEQFAGSLHSVLPVASAAHISFEDISAAIASMTVHGMSADQATQNLADVINHMQKPTKVMTDELGQLGVSSGDLSGMLGKRGLTGTLQFLSQTILEHMGPDGKVLLGSFKQSRDAANDLNTMIASMPPNLRKMAQGVLDGSVTINQWKSGIKGLPAEQAAMVQQFAALEKRSTGFADALKSGGPAAQSYAAALAKATGDATGLNVALMLTGENTGYVQGALKAVDGATTEAGGHVKGWSDVQSTFNQKLSQFKETLGALAIKAGNELLPAAKKLLDVTMGLVGWFTKHKDIAAALVIVFGSLVVLTKAHAAVTAVEAAGGMLKLLQATKLATAAQWLFNLAMDANPIGLVVIAVAALVGVFIYLWFHSSAFRKFFIGLWADIWGFLKAVGAWFAGPFADFFVKTAHFFVGIWNDVWGFLKAVGAWFAGPFADFFVTAARDIAAPFLWLWHNVIDPVWHGILDVIKFVVNIVVSAFHLWEFAMRETVGKAALWLWHSVIEPVAAGIAAAAMWLWHNVIEPTAAGIVTAFKVVAEAGVWLWQNVIVPAAQGIAAAAMWVWHNVIVPVGAGIAAAFKAVADAAMWLWHNAIDPAIHGIADVAMWLWHNVISPVFGWIGSAAHTVADAVKSAFSAISGFISSAFSGAVGIVKGALNGVIGIINDAIGGANSIINTLNKVPGVNFPHIPTIPRLAAGGYTPAVPGGRLAVLGEGGQDEFALPEDKLSRLLDRAVAAGGGHGGAGQRETVYLRPGNELGRLIIEALRSSLYGRNVQIVLGGG